MSESFTKFFRSMLLSSVWQEDDQTVRIWVTMMLLADQHGYVGASIPGLAAESRQTIAKVEEALARFESPDPYSRSQENEGRRIARVDRGWLLLNHSKFREGRDDDARREYERERKRKQRHPTVPDSPGQSQFVPPCLPPSAQAEAEAEAEKKGEMQEGEAGAAAPTGLATGARNLEPAVKPERKPREKPAAQVALSAALAADAQKRGDVAPSLSLSLAQKAAQRVTDHFKANGGSLDDSARLLATAWAARGGGNAWRLTDVPFLAVGRAGPGVSPADREAREARIAELNAQISGLDSREFGARMDGKLDLEAKCKARGLELREELRTLKGGSR